jgi:tetratricopeptide (TPR) repeat protein
MLSDGIGRVEAQEVDSRTVRAILSLAQIHLELDEPAKAMALLGDPRTGPQTLLDRNDARAAGEGLPEAIYRATLRAAIAALPHAEDPDAAMADAIAVMEDLKKRLGGTAEGNRRLMGIYVALARDLQRQLQSSSPAARQSLATGLQTFLTQVAEQAAELNVLYWVAETFATLGETMSGRRAQLSSEARELYQKAAASYQKILDRQQAGQLQVDPTTLAHVRSRLAGTWQTLGEYEEAIDLLEAILRTNDRRLDVQMDAARAYQRWGETGQTIYLDRAVAGGRPNGKTRENVIWGWGKVANVAARQMYRGPQYKEKYRDVFHEARLSIAEARFQQAQQQEGEQRAQSLQRAKTAIVATRTLYPELGGETWRPRYDRLLRQIQQALGEEALGFKAL